MRGFDRGRIHPTAIISESAVLLPDVSIGAHVIVYATRQADGSLSADRITIGKNGFIPPA